VTPSSTLLRRFDRERHHVRADTQQSARADGTARLKLSFNVANSSTEKLGTGRGAHGSGRVPALGSALVRVLASVQVSASGWVSGRAPGWVSATAKDQATAAGCSCRHRGTEQ